MQLLNILTVRLYFSENFSYKRRNDLRIYESKKLESFFLEVLSDYGNVITGQNLRSLDTTHILRRSEDERDFLASRTTPGHLVALPIFADLHLDVHGGQSVTPPALWNKNGSLAPGTTQ